MGIYRERMSRGRIEIVVSVGSVGLDEKEDPQES